MSVSVLDGCVSSSGHDKSSSPLGRRALVNVKVESEWVPLGR